MSSAIPSLERIAFFEGQALTAADLTAAQRSERERRWLHNRALHSWGIGLGLAVHGRRHDTAVTVERGYAVDCLGREILSTQSRTIPVPPAPGGPHGEEIAFYLVTAYLGDAQQNVAERRAGVCAPEGTVRLTEEGLLAWRRPEDVREGLDVILAKAWIQNCRLSRAVALAVRRAARAAQQPHVAAGRTAAGQTAWVAWTTGNTFLGVEVTVDTTRARFHGTPRYLAQVEGARYLAAAPGPLIALGLPAVTEARRDSFTLQVLLPAVSTPHANPPALRQAAAAPGIVQEQLRWHVAWVGVEG